MRNVLEAPSMRRKAEFLDAVARSRRLYRNLVTPPHTAQAFREYLQRIRKPTHIGYWVLTPGDELAGVINVSEIVRGNFRSSYLGYYAFVPHNGRGFMTQGLRAVVTAAFRTHGLHRLEANIQPENEPSRQLVMRLGFRQEGLSRRYLKISGRWRDHERWALTADEWPRLR